MGQILGYKKFESMTIQMTRKNKSITLTNVQASTGAVLASISEFPGYFIDRDADTVYSVKTGTPQPLSVREVGNSKVVSLSKNGMSTTRRITRLRDTVKKFKDVRPQVEANIFTRSAKLTAEDVREIRKAVMPQTFLAFVYGVSDTTISNVINRKSWRWVK
jgi:hypothetical protein